MMLNVTPSVFQPQPLPLRDSPQGIAVAAIAGVVPAMVVGAMIGANSATYTEKQKLWAMRGAVVAGSIAAGLLLLNTLRPMAQPAATIADPVQV